MIKVGFKIIVSDINLHRFSNLTLFYSCRHETSQTVTIIYCLLWRDHSGVRFTSNSVLISCPVTSRSFFTYSFFTPTIAFTLSSPPPLLRCYHCRLGIFHWNTYKLFSLSFLCLKMRIFLSLSIIRRKPFTCKWNSTTVTIR